MELHVDVLKKKLPENAGFRRAWVNRLSAFRREERGSLIIFSLFIFVLMLMISGMAVDLMRAETQRARLQGTLDRAVLAGASLDQTLDSEAVVQDYFLKAGLSDYLTSVTVTQGQNSKSVVASAFMEVDSYFMHMLGINKLEAPANGTAEESLSNIEISLVLDVSGSMGSYSASGQRKITDLINAAQDFVYLMQCNPDPDVLDAGGSPVCTVDPDTVSISIIPYSEQVVVGEDLIQQFNISNEHTYSSCMDFSTADFATTNISLTDPRSRAGNIDPWTSYYNNPNYKYSYDSRRTCRINSWREIVPLSNSYSDLQTVIGNLSYGGNTSIDLGMKWGTALLDPDFRPAVANMASGGSPAVAAAFADRPYDFGARSMQKVVVLMTDGVNTTQNVLKDAYKSGASEVWYHAGRDRVSIYKASTNRYCVLDGSGDQCYWQNSPYSYNGVGSVQQSFPEVWEKFRANMYQDMSWLENPITRVYRSTKNARLNTICSAAKAQGVEIFTIGFETSSTSAAVMSSCASSDAHHFDANGLNLDNTFTSIAREIHELRLTN